MSKITIMIVDDHTLIRETWSYLLGRNEDLEVIAELGDGQRAIEECHRQTEKRYRIP
jgi:DNA-binding NarL/FixJ family response regulator